MPSLDARNLPPAEREALGAVATRLATLDQAWAVGGGTMLAARGLAVRCRDLDLFAEPETARRMAAQMEDLLLPESAPLASPPGGQATWASGFFRSFRVLGVDGDLVGGFARRHAGGIYRVPITADSIDAWLEGDGWRAPLHRAEEWLVLYWLNPKNDGREHLLLRYLSEGRMDPDYMQSILARQGLPASVVAEGRRLLRMARP